MSRKSIKGLGLALSLGIAAAAVAGTPATTFGEPAAPAVVDSNSHLGTFVSGTSTGFTMKDSAGKEHKHTLVPGATITDPNGNPCKITDLKSDQKIKVTTSAEDKARVTKVECVT
ncbi:MAG: hypothetical protein ACK5Q5_20510 [Planctomycetaceae bacterium]